jgi:hypothetical protein
MINFNLIRITFVLEFSAGVVSVFALLVVVGLSEEPQLFGLRCLIKGRRFKSSIRFSFINVGMR